MPPATNSSDGDAIEPYYVAKVTRDQPGMTDGSAAAPAMPPLPCTFESVAPALLTGVLGYVYGTGRKSISMLFNKKKDVPRGIRIVHKDGMSSAKSFALLSFSYSVPLCILKRLREKEDWRNHTAAGAFSGLVIAWGQGPASMLGSAVLLGAVSGYLARAEPVVGPASAATLSNPQQPSQASGSSPSPDSSHKRSTRRRGQHAAPHESHSASITASVCPYSLGLLEQTAHYVNCSGPDPARQSNVALAAATVWAAVKPGCRSCCVPMSDPHTEFL